MRNNPIVREKSNAIYFSRLEKYSAWVTVTFLPFSSCFCASTNCYKLSDAHRVADAVIEASLLLCTMATASSFATLENLQPVLSDRSHESPTAPDRALVPVEFRLELRTVCDAPTVHGRMIDAPVTFEPHCSQVSRPQGSGHVPSDTSADHRFGKMDACAAAGHGRSLAISLRSWKKSISQMDGPRNLARAVTRAATSRRAFWRVSAGVNALMGSVLKSSLGMVILPLSSRCVPLALLASS